MPNPPPRKPFQIHLSTAIVLMFVASGLMWANVTERVGGYDAGSTRFCGSFHLSVLRKTGIASRRSCESK